jgi:hypothetical protein
VNERKTTAAYKQVNQIMSEMDAEFRKARRVPIWRKLASFLGWKKPQAKWLAWWELRHERCMKMARKQVAHSVAGGELKQC